MLEFFNFQWSLKVTIPLYSIINLNVKIIPNLFNGTNYKDWAYSAKMAIGGSRRLGYIDGSIKKPKDNPKDSEWVS